MDLVELQGLPGLTTRRLGAALGCEAMSIYHHFPSKQHLLDALVERAIAGVAEPPPDADPVERLRFPRPRISKASRIDTRACSRCSRCIA